MAQCTALSAVIVSGSGLSAVVAGTYFPTATADVGGNTFTTFTIAGSSDPYIKAEVQSSDYFWLIGTTGTAGTGSMYKSDFYPLSTFPDCPSESTGWNTGTAGESPAPSLVGVPNETPTPTSTPTATPTATPTSTPTHTHEGNTHGLPDSSVHLIEQNHGSVDNFLRLRSQGQI